MPLVAQLQTALRNPDALDLTEFQTLLHEYNQTCRNANLRLRQCLELIQCNNSLEALRLAKAPPDLLDTVADLDFPERDALAEIASELGISVEPLQTDVCQKLFELYNRSGDEEGRSRARDTASSNAENENTRTGQHNRLNQRTVDPDHPWLGLSPYTEDTKEYFFGRDQEVRGLYVRVREQPLTILYGPSGLGKTSLLGAGLIPKLRVEGYQPILLRLGFESGDVPITEQVVYSLSYLLEQQSSSVMHLRKSVSLWELFHRPTRSLVEHLKTPPILIFDQFEEIFTLGNTKGRQKEAEELFRQLADLIENRPPLAIQDELRSDRRLAREFDFGASPVRIVITLREDFLSHLESYKKLMPSLMRNRMAVSMLNGPQALEAVVRPGRLQGRYLVSDEVGARIVRFVANRSPDTPLDEIDAVPPLLSLLCDELNELRIQQQQSTIADNEGSVIGLESLGRNILDGFYTRSFTGLHPSVRDYIEDRMVTIGGHRNPIAFEDAIADLRAAEVSDPDTALNQLILGRLLTSEDRNGVQRLEITHDVLTPLVVRSRDERRERQRAERQVAELAEGYRIQAAQRSQSRIRAIATTASFLSVVLLIGLFVIDVSRQKAKRLEYESRMTASALRDKQDQLTAAGVRMKEIISKSAKSDRGVALNMWKMGRLREAMCYWTRSLEAEPDSVEVIQQVVPLLSSARWPQLRAKCQTNDASFEIVAASGDGSIAATSSGQTVSLWDVFSGQHLADVERLSSTVTHMSLSYSGDVLATLYDDDTLRIWETRSGILSSEFSVDWNSIAKIELNPGASQLLVVSSDSCRILSATGDLLTERRIDGLRGAAFGSDGNSLLTYNKNGELISWDATSFEEGKTIKANGPVKSASYSSNGKWILAGLENGTVQLFDATSGANEMSIVHGGAVTDVAFSVDTLRIITCSDSGSVRIWEAATGNLITTIDGIDESFTSASFSPDGCFAVTCSGHSISLWDVTAANCVTPLLRHPRSVLSSEFSFDGESIVTVDELFGYVWDSLTGSGKFVLIPPNLAEELKRQYTNISSFRHHIRCATCQPNGNMIAVDVGNEVDFWDVRDGSWIKSIRTDGGRVVRFDSSGRFLVSKGEFTFKLWNVATGEQHAQTNCISRIGLNLTPDPASNVMVVDCSNHEVVNNLVGHSDLVLKAKFNANETRIVTASRDRTSRIWDAAKFQQKVILIGHSDSVVDASFSQDGKRLVTSSRDRTTRIWYLGNLDLQPPNWYAALFRYIAGKTLTADGEIVSWPNADESQHEYQDLLANAEEDDSDYGRVALALLRPFLDRPAFVGSDTSQFLAADSLVRLEATAFELDMAYGLNPAHPIVHIAIAKHAQDARFSSNVLKILSDSGVEVRKLMVLDRGMGFEGSSRLVSSGVDSDFLREYGVSRLLKRQPSDKESAADIAALCRRAEAFLTDQDDQPRTKLVRQRAEELEAIQ